MRRRDFIMLVGGTAASWPLAARAQQAGKVYRIAIVHPSNPVSELTETSSIRAWRALFQNLRRLGYREGQNLIVERYSGEGRTERYAELARLVVETKPDLIVAISTIMVKHFKATSTTIPIVGVMADPIALGLAVSRARPGGNITGVSLEAGSGEIWGKRLALLKEAVPSLSKVSYLTLRSTWEGPDGLAVREASQRIGVSLLGAPLEGTVERIAELAQEHRLPAMYPFYESAEVGGLLSYAFDSVELWRVLADSINEILKGASPAELPIYQVTKLKLIVNMKAARAIGLTIPPAFVLRADEVIE